MKTAAVDALGVLPGQHERALGAHREARRAPRARSRSRPSPRARRRRTRARRSRSAGGPSRRCRARRTSAPDSAARGTGSASSSGASGYRPGREQEDGRLAGAEHLVGDAHAVALDEARLVRFARPRHAPCCRQAVACRFGCFARLPAHRAASAPRSGSAMPALRRGDASLASHVPISTRSRSRGSTRHLEAPLHRVELVRRRLTSKPALSFLHEPITLSGDLPRPRLASGAVVSSATRRGAPCADPIRLG